MIKNNIRTTKNVVTFSLFAYGIVISSKGLYNLVKDYFGKTRRNYMRYNEKTTKGEPK